MIQDDRWKQDIIEQEKERLLREHLPYIDGFMPKSIIQQPQDTKYFTNTRQFNQHVPAQQHQQNLIQNQSTQPEEYFKRRNYKKTSLW